MGDHLPDVRDTPYGPLYRSRPWWVQVSILLGAFTGSIGMGSVAGRMFGGVSENAGTFLCVPFVLILFAGYALWSARSQVLAFNFLGKGILKALFKLLILRKKPERMEDVLSPREKFVEMAVRAQRAASSFFVVSWPIAAVASVLALVIESPNGPIVRVAVVVGLCLGWGFFLSRLGQRGFLPIMEEE